MSQMAAPPPPVRPTPFREGYAVCCEDWVEMSLLAECSRCDEWVCVEHAAAHECECEGPRAIRSAP